MGEPWTRLVQLGRRLGYFLAGSATVQGLNMVTGLAILWILPVEQYAIYIACSSLIAIGSVGSDAGVSQALLTLGSRAAADRERVARIFMTGWRMRRQAMVLVSLLVLLASAVMGSGQGWSWTTWLILVLLVTATNWAQLRISSYTSLFNIYQDTRSIFLFTVSPAILRMLLVLVLCQRFALAYVALGINLLGFVVQDVLAGRLARAHLQVGGQPDAEIRRSVLAFMVPLIPGIIYYIFQGQIAVFLLTWLGQTSSIAEVGALGRLQQVFFLLNTLNSFFVHPHFARLSQARPFIRRAALLGGVATGFAALVMVSAFVLDDWWVLILGSQYGQLQGLIPLAIAGCLITLAGGTVYTLVIATKFTRYQWLQIPLGLGTQLMVMFWSGVHTTGDALLITYAPAASYLMLQLMLLMLAMRTLTPDPRPEPA